MKFKELTNQSEAELKSMLLNLRSEAHELAANIRLGQHKQTHKLGGLRKDIARIMTLLKQKIQN